VDLLLKFLGKGVPS